MMAQIQASSAENPLVTEFVASRDNYISKQVASETTELILQKLLDMIDKREKFKNTVKHFSKTKIIKNIHQVNTLNLYEQAQNSKPIYPAGRQPIPLVIDSLLPKSASIDLQNTYKKNQKNLLLPQQNSFIQKKRTVKKQTQESLYHKLDLKQESEDGFTKQLRRMQEQKVSKVQAEKRAKQLQNNLLNAKLKDKKKERQEVFSFDYNGSQIKLRTEQKTNLISKLVQEKVNNNTKTVKQAFDDKNPTSVDGSVVKNGKKNNLAALKIRDDVRFNDNRSLSEGISVGGSIKYTYEGKTLQGKIKSLSTIELKRSMHQRMLSKVQFEKVKSLNGSQIGVNDLSQLERQISQLKMKSEIKNQKLRKVNEKSQKIIVNNEILKIKLLQSVNQYIQQRKQPQNPEYQKISLSFVDIFNMNYLKSGGNVKQQKDKKAYNSTKASSISLPKIIHTSLSSSLPKEREKIKNKSNVILKIRKTFQDKLRT